MDFHFELFPEFFWLCFKICSHIFMIFDEVVLAEIVF